MSKAKSLATWTARVLAGFFAVLVILIVAGILQARIILSDSMEPSIRVNDLVVGASWLNPNPGEVALYQERDVDGAIKQDVVHRVVSINSQNEFQFKGDNNQVADALLVPRADVKGVIFLKIPAVGAFFSLGGGLTLAAMILGIWAISYGISRLVSAKRPKDEES